MRTYIFQRYYGIRRIKVLEKKNKEKYPNLATVAKCSLTNSHYKRKEWSCFTIAGCLIREKRAKIELLRAEKVLFVHDNYIVIWYNFKNHPLSFVFLNFILVLPFSLSYVSYFCLFMLGWCAMWNKLRQFYNNNGKYFCLNFSYLMTLYYSQIDYFTIYS